MGAFTPGADGSRDIFSNTGGSMISLQEHVGRFSILVYGAQMRPTKEIP